MYQICFFKKLYVHLGAWKTAKFESVFLLDFLLPYWFFINLQSKCKLNEFAFLKTTIMIFYLIYSFNVRHCKQTPSFVSLEDSVLICSVHFANILPCCNMCRGNHTEMILTFLFVWLWIYHCHGKWNCIKQKLHSLLISLLDT